MAQPYYGHQGDMGFCRRSSRGMILQVPQQHRADGQQAISDHDTSRASPAPESEGKSSGPPTRRRIPVACGRCRRRKIKCSGDLGNGQGCTNCRSSGTPNCLFLRVNSSLLHPKTGYSTWPYPTMGSSAPTTSAANQCSYGVQSAARVNSFSISSASSTSPSYPRTQSACGYGTDTPSATVARSFYTPGCCSLGYDEETACDMTSPILMLPSTDSGGVGGFCGPPGSPKAWNAISQVSKTSSGELYFDPDSHGQLGASNYHFIPQSPLQASISPDIPSLFPIVTSLSSNLPGQDRTLPNPTSCRNSSVNGSTTSTHQQESPPNSSFASGQIQNYRATNQWGLESIPSTTSQTSPRMPADGVIPASPPINQKATSPSPQDMGFGYIPISSSPSASTNSSVPYVRAETDTVDGFQASAGPNPGKGLSKDSVPSTDTYSSDVYSYSTEKCKRRPAADLSSSGTLMSGQQYTRLRQSHPQRTPSFSIFRTESTDFRVPAANATCIPPLNNIDSF